MAPLLGDTALLLGRDTTSLGVERRKRAPVSEHLRPIERRVLAMSAAGLDHREIAEKLNRSPRHVERVIGWSQIPRSRPPARRTPRAVERRVLDLRSEGESHDEIATRFKRSPRSIRQIEGLAHFRLALDLLEREENHP